MKVVVNKNYGGFGLSDVAKDMLKELVGIDAPYMALSIIEIVHIWSMW